MGRVLATPPALLERRVLRARHELDAGRDEDTNRELAARAVETFRAALVQAEADLALYRMASTKSDSETRPSEGLGRAPKGVREKEKERWNGKFIRLSTSCRV